MPLSKEKKTSFHAKMTRILGQYTKMFVVGVDNVGSSQMNITRLNMRGRAEMLMGKNTLMKKVLKDFMEENPDHPMGAIDSLIQGNVGFVFTNTDLPAIRDIILSNRVPAPARPGAVAPINVQIPAGPTGCDPGQTSFFQVLQIPTKIVKGQIEITSTVDLIVKGNKVGDSEAALLSKLNIRPFSYGLVIHSVFDNGDCFSAAVLDIDQAYLACAFHVALAKLAAISFSLNYPTAAMVPHAIGNAFKALVAVAVELDGTYSFPEAEAYKEAIKNPSAGGAPAGPGAAAPAAAKEEKPTEEEVDPMEGGMDMFGGGGGGGDY
jgi:large subunit ribosomal protein LP0